MYIHPVFLLLVLIALNIVGIVKLKNKIEEKMFFNIIIAAMFMAMIIIFSITIIILVKGF